MDCHRVLVSIVPSVACAISVSSELPEAWLNNQAYQKVTATVAVASIGLDPNKRIVLYATSPQRYFTDLLTRLVNGWPNDRIDELMPWCWADPQEPTASAEGTKGL